MLGGRVVKVNELEKVKVREVFKQLVMNEWEKVRNARVVSEEEEWKLFKCSIIECAARVCGYKNIGTKSKRSMS